jgi:trimethylamine--corrinoid protein Co-methyltransferase
VKKTNSLWAALQSGSNMLYHAVGWLAGGLIARPEIFLMECEILQ